MKKLIVLLIFLILLSPCVNAKEMRGVWVSTVYGIDYPQEQTSDYNTLIKQADIIIENIKKAGLNTVFLQVRPSSDAIYPSNIFPISRHLTGDYNLTVNGDVLQHWIDKAHNENLEIHAWVNPFRITTGGDEEYNRLSESHPAKQHAEWIIKANNNYYFDPAVPEVRELICAGIEEILINYDIDGIHMDDYFYPNAEFDDSESFLKYGQGWSSIEDWRRNNINTLIIKLNDLVHKYNSVFGISPSAIWANKKDNPLGSDTDGFSSFLDIYADTRKWAVEGWIDYIAPQIYFENGHKTADFQTLLNWWSDTLMESETALYVGLADYRIEDPKSLSIWHDGSEISKQITQIRKNIKAEGAIHFSYSSVFNYTNNLNALIEKYIEFDNGGFNSKQFDGYKYGVCAYYDENWTLVGAKKIESTNFDNNYIRENAPDTAFWAKCCIIKDFIGENEYDIVKIVM